MSAENVNVEVLAAYNSWAATNNHVSPPIPGGEGWLKFLAELADSPEQVKLPIGLATQLKAHLPREIAGQVICLSDGAISGPFNKWADDAELFVLMPFVPEPGGQGWDYLVSHVAGGSEAVKFSKELAETLLWPWISDEVMPAVIKGNEANCLC